MNSRKRLALIGALTCALPLAANAGGFYVGAGIGNAEYESAEFLDCDSCDTFSDNDFAYNLYAGYSLTDAVAVEIAWQDWGTGSDNWFGDSVEVEPTMVTVMAVGTAPIGGDFSLFGKAGVAFLSIDVDNKDNGYSNSSNSQELALGGGVQWDISNFGIRLETLWVDAEDADKALMWGVSGLFKFGG